MKTELTKDQSERLLELGVPWGKASIKLIDEILCGKGVCDESYEIAFRFTLADLLEILPKELNRGIVPYTFHLRVIHGRYEATYRNPNAYLSISDMCCGEELIDALYELLCWVIENGHLKFD